jgi:hypothetical protein
MSVAEEGKKELNLTKLVEPKQIVQPEEKEFYECKQCDKIGQNVCGLGYFLKAQLILL